MNAHAVCWAAMDVWLRAQGRIVKEDALGFIHTTMYLLDVRGTQDSRGAEIIFMGGPQPVFHDIGGVGMYSVLYRIQICTNPVLESNNPASAPSQRSVLEKSNNPVPVGFSAKHFM